MTKKTLPFYISFLLLILVGCQNGCTTKSTIKKEHVVIERNGHKVIVTAKLMDFRNSKRKNSRRLFPRKVTHSYGIEFNVSGLGLKQLHFYSENVNNPDNVDLGKYLKRVKIAISKDGGHLALGYDNEIIKVFHLYKGKEIGATFLDINKSSAWSSLNINGYPSPEDIILNELSENCDFSILLEDNVNDLFEDLKPSDSAHVLLLNKWPDCRTARDYYKGKNLKKLSKNKTWKSYAVARAEEVLGGNFHGYLFFENMEFYEVMNSKELNLMIEDYLVNNWRSNSDRKLANYIIENLQKKGGVISKSGKELIYNDAQSVLDEFLNKGDVSFTKDPEKCMGAVLAYGDTTNSYRIIEEGILAKNSKMDPGTLTEVLYTNEFLLTSHQRKLLNDNIELYFKNLSPDDKADVFHEVNKSNKCRLLRKWKMKYPDELRFSHLSIDC